MKERGCSVLRRGEMFQWKHGHKYYYNTTLFMFIFIIYIFQICFPDYIYSNLKFIVRIELFLDNLVIISFFRTLNFSSRDS